MFGPLLGLAGSVISGVLGNKQADKQLDQQKDFAQKGIRWKVADAKAAGIHPVYAMGSQPFNFSPVPVGTPDFGAALGEMGANIDRSVLAQKTAPQRANIIGTSLGLERGKLENDLLRVQIEKTKRELPPPMQAVSSSGKGNLVMGPGGQEVMKTSTDVLYPIKNAEGVVDYVRVRNPMLGQNMENHYGEIGSAAVGTPALLSDAAPVIQAKASDYIPYISWAKRSGNRYR